MMPFTVPFHSSSSICVDTRPKQPKPNAQPKQSKLTGTAAVAITLYQHLNECYHLALGNLLSAGNIRNIQIEHHNLSADRASSGHFLTGGMIFGHSDSRTR